MRWAIGILLALNLTVFLWFGVLDPNRHHAGTKLPEPEKGSLRLISELPIGGRQVKPSTSVEQSVVVQPLAKPVEKVSPAEPAAQRPSPTEPIPLAKTQTALTPRVEEAPEQSEPEVPAVPTVQLAPEPVPVAEAKPTAPLRACWEFGNFPGTSQVDTVAGALPEGLEVLQRVQAEAEQLIGYYVLVPSAGDMATARETDARLRENGFNDTWLFRSGSLRGAISLGLFSRRVNAERHAKQVRDKGFEAELREKYRGKPVYRLQVSGNDNALVRQSVKRVSAGTAKRIDCPPNDG